MPPKPNPEKGEPGLDFWDAVGPAVNAIVPVDCATVSEPRSRRSRMSRQASTGANITLKGMQIAEMVCRGLIIAASACVCAQDFKYSLEVEDAVDLNEMVSKLS